MRLSRYFLPPLLLACPLWLAACSNPADAPPVVDQAAAPMTAAGAAAPDETEAPAPNEPTAPVMPNAADAGADETRARIERLLGDAGQYERVFTQLQQSVASGDRAAVSKLMRYPLRVDVAGSKREVADAAAFQRDYDSIVTAPVARAIAAQSFATVFVNQQGVMIGNGQVWLNGECLDQACSQTDVKVTTLQE